MRLIRALTLAANLIALGFVSCVPDQSVVKDAEQSVVKDYLTPDLRRDVEKLKVDVASQPTTAENILKRAKVLWRWANAYALTGRPIHPELPSSIAQLSQTMRRGKTASARLSAYGDYLDWFVREFSFNDDNPGAIGNLSTTKLGPFIVDTYVTISQTYTVGNAPMRPGGGLLVASRYHNGMSAFQCDSPADDGYISAESSNPDVELVCDTLPVFGMFSGQLGGTRPRPYFRIARGELRHGDTVTIDIGDKRQGSRGFKLPSASNDAMRFKIWVSLGNPKELYTLAELPFYSVGGKTVGVRGFGPSIVKTGEAIDLTIRSEDAFRNRATSGFPRYDVYEGDLLLASAHDTGRAIQTVSGLKLSEPGAHHLVIRSSDGRIAGEVNPILVEADPTERIYWGETHGHCGFAEGSGTPDGFYAFAREDARLDFMTLSEHDLWMDDYEWEVLRNATIRDNEPGRFITFLGYEWTTPNAFGGHHNVLFRTPEGRDRVAKQEAPVLSELYRRLKEKHDAEDVIVIPHAHNPGQWWVSDAAVERLVEIVSNHGTFEWLGRAYLANGYRLGFIGGSDDHIGHPGLRPISIGKYGSDNFGGLAAVMAGEKTRDAIFDAMRDRRTYATNGMRMILRTNVNGEAGGRAIGLLDKQIIAGRVIGTAPIDRIALIKNGSELQPVDYRKVSKGSFETVEFRFFSESDPHRKSVKSRGWRVWRGTLKVSGAKIVDVETPNVENKHREFARISDREENVIAFFIRTRGAPKNIILRLEGAGPETQFRLNSSGGKRKLFRHLFTAEAMMDDAGEVVYSSTRLHRDYVKGRFVSTPVARDRQFKFVDSQPGQKGDTYFVRATQIDGGIAWSSPVWVE